jgi:hypothetical protein
MSFRGASLGFAAGPIRLQSSTAVWLWLGPARFKSFVCEARWSTASTAGTSIAVSGGLSSGSTDRANICVLRSTAKGQKASTGTATKMAHRIKLTPTGTFSAGKWADVWVTAALSS